MTNRIAAVLQVSGVLALAVAGWDVSRPLGVAIAGLGALAFGVAAERSGEDGDG